MTTFEKVSSNTFALNILTFETSTKGYCMERLLSKLNAKAFTLEDEF